VSRAERARVVFEADTLDELVRKCKAFIGQNSPASTAVALYGATTTNTWPIPSWAPKGSKWTPRQTLPMLVGPDGKEIAISWVAGTPQKPKAKREPVV
jgi:hypothetical protein